MDKIFRIINYLGLNYDNNILSTSITATKDMFLSNNDKNKNIHNDDTLLKITQIKLDAQIKLEQIKLEQIKYEDCMKYEQNFNYCYNLFK